MQRVEQPAVGPPAAVEEFDDISSRHVNVDPSGCSVGEAHAQDREDPAIGRARIVMTIRHGLNHVIHQRHRVHRSARRVDQLRLRKGGADFG